MLARVVTVVAAIGLAACGGGGGSDLRIVLLPTQLALAAYPANLPMQATAQIQLKDVSSADADLYIAMVDNGDVFTTIDLNPVDNGFVVGLTTASELDYGAHTSSLTVLICRDAECQDIVRRKDLPYTMTVTHPQFTIPADPIATSAIVGDVVPVRLFQVGTANDQVIYGRVTDSAGVFSDETFELYKESQAWFIARMPVAPTTTAEPHAGTLTLDICDDPDCDLVLKSQALSYSVQLLEVVAGKVGTAAYVDGAAADSRFESIRDIAVDGTGTLFVAEIGGNGTGRLRMVTPAGVVSTVYSATSSDYPKPLPTSVTVDGSNNVYFGGNTGVYRRTAAGVVQAVNTDNATLGLSVDAAGNVWSNQFNQQVQRAPNGTLLRQAAIESTYDIHVDATGKLYLARRIGISVLGTDGSLSDLMTDKFALRLAPETTDTFLFIGADDFYSSNYGVHRVTLGGAHAAVIPPIPLPNGTDLPVFGLAVGAGGTVYLCTYNAVFRTTVPGPSP